MVLSVSRGCVSVNSRSLSGTEGVYSVRFVSAPQRRPLTGTSEGRGRRRGEVRRGVVWCLSRVSWSVVDGVVSTADLYRGKKQQIKQRISILQILNLIHQHFREFFKRSEDSWYKSECV